MSGKCGNVQKRPRFSEERYLVGLNGKRGIMSETQSNQMGLGNRVRQWLRRRYDEIAALVNYLLLNIYAIAVLILGVVFVAYVEQTREIFANLLAPTMALSEAEDTRLRHLWLYVGSLALWGWAIWYSMRVLSSTSFPRNATAEGRHSRFANWLNAQGPRLLSFAGVTSVAFASRYLSRERLHCVGCRALRWVSCLWRGSSPSGAIDFS